MINGTRPLFKQTKQNWKALYLCLFLIIAIATCTIALSACTQSSAQTTARTIQINNAMEDDYQKALSAIQEKAEDAKLVAVRTSTYANSEAAPSWMYLFYSWNRATAYTVFVVDGNASVGETGNLPFTQDDFEAVPGADEIAYDAADAYQMLVESLAGDGDLLTCRAYLMTYVEGDEDPTEDALIWFFSFNEPNSLDDSDESNTSTAGEPCTYGVNAQTGEVVEISVENQNAE